jgi:hypothetical protein
MISGIGSSWSASGNELIYDHDDIVIDVFLISDGENPHE